MVSAMPEVARALDSVRNYSLAFSLFMTTSLLGTVVGGSWADARGPFGPTFFGVVGFLVGLAICGAASSFPVLLLGRALSGVGAGLFIVALYVALALGYEERDRPRVFGYLSAAWVVPALVGPAIAGWLTDNVSWRWVFLAVIPFGLAAMAGLWRPLQMLSQDRARVGDEGRARLLAGVGLCTGAFAAQWAGQDLADGPPWLWLVLVGGVGLGVASLRRLVPDGTLRARKGLPAVIASRGLFTAAFFAGETFVPLSLIQERHFSVTQAGLSLSLASVAWAVAAWLQGRNPHWQPRVMIASGAAAIALSLLGLTVVFLTGASGWLVVPMWAIGGFGMGLSQPAQATAMLALAPEGRQGNASSALQLADALGNVTAVTAVGSVFAAAHSSDDSGLFAGIWLALALMALVAMTVSRARIPRLDVG